MTKPQCIETFLNEKEVASILGISVATVRRWRLLAQGPRWVKVSGSAVRYSPESLKSYLASRPTGGGE
jgi:predicted DNA-binding transcriptional regulator AlpA